MKANPLRNHWVGKTGAVGGIGSTLALLGTGPVEAPTQPEPMDPPAIVVEALPQPEEFYLPAMPQPQRIKTERVVTETERVKDNGETIIHRTYEPTGEEIDTEAFATEVEAWAHKAVTQTREKFEEYQEQVIEFVSDPVFEETTQDAEELHQHVEDAATIVQRIIVRAEEEPWLVLTALLGYLASMFAEPKKQPKDKTDE